MTIAVKLNRNIYVPYINMYVKSIKDIIVTFSGNNDNKLRILQDMGLIARRMRCKRRNCRRYCSLIRKSNEYLGHVFKCNRCKLYRSMLDGSFFQGSHLSIINIFMLLWLWCCRSRPVATSNITNISKKHSTTTYKIFT